VPVVIETLRAFIDSLVADPALLLVAGFLIAFLEALAVVGLLVPGILLLLLIGAGIGWDPPLMAALTAAFALGAMLGDGLSFLLGRRYRERLAAVPIDSRFGRWLAQGRDFFARHGGRSVFIARFLGPLRPVVPLVAGSLGLAPRQFLPRMVLAGLLWAPAMVVPGALFGESLELAAEFGGRLVVLLLLLFVGGWLVVNGVRFVYGWSARRSTWWMKRLGRWLRDHPRLGRLAGPLLVPGQREVLPVLGLAGVLLVSFALLLTLLTLAVLQAGPMLSERVEITTLAGSLRTPLADPLFVVLGLAGSWPVALTVGIGLALFFAATRRREALIHWLLAVGVGSLLAWGLAALLGQLPFRVARPDLPFATLVLLHGFLAVVAAKGLQASHRKWLYLAISAVLALLAFARLYLGQAQLYALAVALALAVSWLTLVGIAYRVRARTTRPRMAVGLIAVFVVLAAAGAAVANALDYGALLRDQQSAPEVVEVDGPRWWATGRSAQGERLPDLRTVLGNDEVQRFDIELAAREGDLVEAFDRAGWQPLPALDADALRAVFRARLTADALPHLPRDFNGRAQEFARRLPLSDGRWVVVRGWRSGWRLSPDARPVWLLQLRLLEPVTVAGLFNTWRRRDDPDGRALEAVRSVGGSWAWRAGAADEAWRVDAAQSSSSSSSSKDVSSSVSSSDSGASNQHSARSRSIGSVTASSS
jgi:undecaprenyl-diphosphatase